MSHVVLDGAGVLQHVHSMGEGTSGEPLKMVVYNHIDADVDLGVIFTHSDRHIVSNNNSFYYLLKTPPSPIHVELISFSVTANGGPVFCEIYEDAIVSANGTLEGFLNNNRQLNIASSCLLYESPTVTDEGLLLITSETGGEKGKGGIQAGTDQRWVFDFSSNYLIKLENKSGATVDLAVTIVVGED